MKVNWGVIKFVIITLVIVLLFGFTKQRNEARKLSKIEVEFLDENDPFITLESVNKLLIQNFDSVTSIAKETLVLKEMESRLMANDMIRDAQVFVTVPGVLGAKIQQRKPIARVAAATHYYIDEDGKKMPLSSVYTARVPLVTGATNAEFAEIVPLLLAIKNDSFMEQSVIGLYLKNENEIVLQMRKQAYKVHFGTALNWEKKFQNYKAFYKKAKQDSTLNSYGKIDLKFGNQVVATKK